MYSISSIFRMLLLGVCCALSIRLVTAQVTTATVYGIVNDATGAVVPGAMVSLTNVGTSEVYRKVSDAAGEFGFQFLPVGTYTLRIEAQGFKALETSGITFTAGQQTRQTYQLDIGAVTETLKVEGTAPLLNTVSAEQQQSIDSTTAKELPLARRDFSGLLKLGTGVSTATNGTVRMNGAGEAGTNFSVDGTAASGNTEGRTYAAYGNPSYIQIMSLEGIAEVQTVKGIAPAEYSDALGGQVNLITRSGTNQWHGSLFENFQAENLNARNQFLTKNVPLTFNQFGASSGGAIRKDKIFLFGDYEGYQERSTPIVQGTVPTQIVRDQILAAVPSFHLVLDPMPLPNQPNPGPTTGTYLSARSSQKSDNHVDLKGDVLLGAAGRLSLSYSHGRPFYNTPSIFLNGANDRSFNNVQERGGASYTTGGGSWTSETHFGYAITDIQRIDAFFNQKNPLNSTEQFAFGQRLPYVSTSLGWNTASSELWSVTGPTWSINSKISKQIGKHSLKFGGDYTHQCCSRTDPQNPEFHYATLAQILSNTPTTVTANFGNGVYTADIYHFGFFAQDEYRIRTDLVLDIGLRNDSYSNLVVHALGSQGAGTGFYNPDGILDSSFHVGPVRPQDSPYNPDHMNIAPRFGFSYSPGKAKTVIRGGFGIFFSSQVPGAMWQTVQSGPVIPFRTAFTQQDVLKYGLHYGQYTDDLRNVVAAQQAQTGILSTFSIFNPNLQNPYSMQYSLGIQREITPTLVLETSYVGLRGVKFLAQRPMNLPDRVTGIKPNPLLSVTYYVDNSQQSEYNSWQTSLHKRYSKNFSGTFHYTWSRLLAPQGGDNGTYYQGDAATVNQNFFNYNADRGPGAGDVTHVVASNWLYQLPGLEHQKWLRPVFGGWQVSAIFTAQTGSAFTITQSSALPASRPDYLGGAVVLPDYRTTLRYLNTADFARVQIIGASGATARPGNVGAGEIRGPGLWNIDFSLAKNFKLTERAQLQIRTDMFDALNHTNYSGLITEITNPRFGLLTSTLGARTIQLNARLSW